MASKVQLRRDTAANWTSGNPTLDSGEIGWETDTRQLKIGDGATAWTSLAYAAPVENFIARTSAKTMTSNTNLQALFDGTGGTTNGRLTVLGSVSYFFEASIALSSMSGTSGNFGFSIVGAGTATFTSAAWHAIGLDATTQNTAAAVGGIWSASSAETGNVITAGTGTAASAIIKGIFRINAGGTIIPSIQLTTAATAAIAVNTWFKCYAVGSNTVISVGNWS